MRSAPISNFVSTRRTSAGTTGVHIQKHHQQALYSEPFSGVAQCKCPEVLRKSKFMDPRYIGGLLVSHEIPRHGVRDVKIGVKRRGLRFAPFGNLLSVKLWPRRSRLHWPQALRVFREVCHRRILQWSCCSRLWSGYPLPKY